VQLGSVTKTCSKKFIVAGAWKRAVTRDLNFGNNNTGVFSGLLASASISRWARIVCICVLLSIPIRGKNRGKGDLLPRKELRFGAFYHGFPVKRAWYNTTLYVGLARGFESPLPQTFCTLALLDPIMSSKEALVGASRVFCSNFCSNSKFA
jgi:hypothetical protein